VERRATPRLKTRVREVLCCLEGQRGGGIGRGRAEDSLFHKEENANKAT